MTTPNILLSLQNIIHADGSPLIYFVGTKYVKLKGFYTCLQDVRHKLTNIVLSALTTCTVHIVQVAVLSHFFIFAYFYIGHVYIYLCSETGLNYTHTKKYKQ